MDHSVIHGLEFPLPPSPSFPISPMSEDGIVGYFRPLLLRLHEVFGSLPFFDPTNICIAGGAVRDLQVGMEPKDIDVYLPVTEEFITLITSCLGSPRHSVLTIFLKCISCVGELAYESDFGRERVKGETSLDEALNQNKAVLALIGGMEWRGKPVQFIMVTPSTTVDQILDTFDLDICMFGVTLNGFIKGRNAPECLKECLKGGSTPAKLFNYWQNSQGRYSSFDERGWDMSEAFMFMKTHPPIQDPPFLVFSYRF